MENLEEIKPYKEELFKVSDIHNIWIGQFGNPDGQAVFCFHGGPGAKSKTKHFKHIDLEKYRVVQIDQRGCGLSTPQGEIKENTTKDLIEDIEKVRMHLGIEKVILSGGSWGTTIALLYTEKYPENVAAMFLRGIFLTRKRDVEWLFGETGAARIFPDLWKRRMEFLHKNNVKVDDASKFFLEKLTVGNDEEKKQIAAAVEDWEGNILTLENEFKLNNIEELTDEDINCARIFSHYDVNNYFITENEILNNIERIKNIPTAIIHGRYDIVCPVDQAFDLHEKLNNSTLEITNFDGHKLGKESIVLSKYMFETLINKIN